MFSLFKINDPYRLIAIVLIGLAIKLPFIIGGCATTEMQYWLLLGEAIDNTSMYKGVLDNLAPLAAGSYWLIVFVAGKSITALHILGTLLLILQAVIFNNLTIRNKVYEQNTYLPAFVYLIIGSIQYELSVFSPAQLGMTFILLAFSQLLSHVEFRAKRDEQIMSIGLLVGIAALFYLPLIIFLPIILIILLVFTSTLSRRYAILMISAAMPLFVAMAYYWVIHGQIIYFISHFINPTFDPGFSFNLNDLNSIFTYLPLALLMLAGYLTMPQQRRLNNYQNRLAQLFFMKAILLISIPFLADLDASAMVLLYIPVLAFISTHLFYLVRQPLTDLLVSALFLGAVLFMTYQAEFQFTRWPGKANPKAAVTPELAKLVKGRKIWVLGDHKELYTYGSIGTAFFNWSLAQPFLNNLNYYDNLVFIQESVDHFDPEIILDYDFRWRPIVEHIPALEQRYEQVRPFVWQRRPE